MTLLERINQTAAGGTVQSACGETYRGSSCTRSAGHSGTHGDGTVTWWFGDPGLPVWRRLQLERLAESGYRAEKALS